MTAKSTAPAALTWSGVTPEAPAGGLTEPAMDLSHGRSPGSCPARCPGAQGR